MVERVAERFRLAGVEALSVLVAANAANWLLPFRASLDWVEVRVVDDIFSAIAQTLEDYSEQGIAHSFIASASTYTETDLLDLSYFHREARQAATRAFDHEGALDLWVVDCSKAQVTNLGSLLAEAELTGASYLIRECVRRIVHPRELRRLAVDALRGRCALRPSGKEIRPGIWLDDRAEVHRRARILAPASSPACPNWWKFTSLAWGRRGNKSPSPNHWWRAPSPPPSGGTRFACPPPKTA
jgi:hypothetical protein